MPKVIHLNAARVQGYSGIKTMMLKPGRNVIEDDSLFEDVKKRSEPFQDDVDKGVVVVHGETLDIRKMTVAAAIQVIELEATKDGIEDVLRQETTGGKGRKSVVDAANDKLKAIALAEQAPKETEGASVKAKKTPEAAKATLRPKE